MASDLVALDFIRFYQGVNPTIPCPDSFFKDNDILGPGMDIKSGAYQRLSGSLSYAPLSSAMHAHGHSRAAGHRPVIFF